LGKNLAIAMVNIEGTRPLLWHAFTTDAIPSNGKLQREGTAGNDPSEWKRTVLATSEGQLYLHASYVFAAIRDGGRHTSRKRSTLQPYIAATLQVLDSIVLVDRFLPDDPPPTDPTSLVYLDVRGVKNPTTKGRNVRYRVAAASGWKASFKILWDTTVISRSEMESVLTDAGRFVGIGDGRSIGFGRFTVTEFDLDE
jgi:hypothetical protein